MSRASPNGRASVCRMIPTEDPKDTRDTIIYNERMDHQRHIRHEEFHPNTCRFCRVEIDMVRG